MPRFNGRAHTPPLTTKLTPPDRIPETYGDPAIDQTMLGPDGTRTNNVGFFPASETRVMLANRMVDTFQPTSQRTNTDPQKGGMPGVPTGSGGITSQSVTGKTTVAGVPDSPIKRSYGLADWSSAYPAWPGSHQFITLEANPNRPQVNPTPFNTEGPSANTQYSTPSPWAAGVFIG